MRASLSPLKKKGREHPDAAHQKKPIVKIGFLFFEGGCFRFFLCCTGRIGISPDNEKTCEIFGAVLYPFFIYGNAELAAFVSRAVFF